MKFSLNMSRHVAALLLLLCVMVLPSYILAADRQYAVSDVPNVRLTDKRQYVSDPTGILSPSARDSINSMLSHLETSTGIETAVVMLPSIGDADIFDFAHELFRKWGIGKKKSDNGFLVLFVMDQHKVRFTTGYGIEGTMTDALSKRIQTQLMVPRFKEGDWDGGMTEGIKAAVKVLDGSMAPDDNDGDEDSDLIAIALLLGAVGFVVLIIYIMGERQRCPKCHRKGMKSVSTQTLRDSSRRRIRRTIYICPHCGHTMTRDERIDDNSSGGFLFIPGGFSGGGSSGGGFSGGNFGGGSTGGGGSTSEW